MADAGRTGMASGDPVATGRHTGLTGPTRPGPSRVGARLLFLAWALPTAAAAQASDPIPLPEHPRPDFTRDAWINLNGTWDFRFDARDEGRSAGWPETGLPAPTQITVPFPWGSPLSGVPDTARIGWYARSIEIPMDWTDERVFLVIGASDWMTTAWLDGQELGTHRGGYTPFEFELTPYMEPGVRHRLVLRVDDADRDFKLEGKQGYGNARGIWQTPYVEARGDVPLETLRFSPDLAGETVRVEARLLEATPEDLTLTLRFPGSDLPIVREPVPAGVEEVAFSVDVPEPRLWSLDDPFLYEVEATLGRGTGSDDVVDTYFGMREIGVAPLPGSDIPYVTLNGEPVYLQLTLDQAYHPEGYYAFPNDDFVRDEVLRAKRIGLNGLRVHVKVPLPRKLYWADRLGMLIMADVPNSWGEPTPEMRQEVERALRGMIARDYNHPAVFAWVPFNETWGLRTEVAGEDVYLPETQEWVASIYRLAKSLDPTRLVEDNSVCCGVGHTETDINSWHAYLPGWAWGAHLDGISEQTYAGSAWNFEEGYRQAGQPNINSEFGNVWGYEGSTGDVDFSWDYHRAIDAFRRHPKIAGWLYTEHHDVINEWNGYWRYDRSDKETGLGELVAGMSLRDLHAPLYVVVGDSASREARPGQTIEVPLYASFLSGDTAYGSSVMLRTTLYGWNALGERKTYGESRRRVAYRPWLTTTLAPLTVTMPDEPSVVLLVVRLEDPTGRGLHRNFTTFIVDGEPDAEVTLGTGRTARVVRLEPTAFDSARWSLKQWTVLDGLKVNGAGTGFFEYGFPWPPELDREEVETALLVLELSSKQLFGKDRGDGSDVGGDYMRGGGTYDASRNPNAYPMTDEDRIPSAVAVRFNGYLAGRLPLHDDPADHRGILSWHSQKRDGRLREAGSYGDLKRVAVPGPALDAADRTGQLVVRLEVGEALPGGLAIYGRRFGRYPVDPTLVFVLREQPEPSTETDP
jgi:hypothetical protein